MLKKITALSRILKSQGLRNEALLISILLKFAGYDDEWRERIENLSRQNRYPFSDWFGNQKRVYYPFKNTAEETFVDEEVEEELEASGYEITDYLGGYCQKDGRTFKIGKVLNKLKREEVKKVRETINEEHAKGVEETFNRIINTFINSEYRTNKKYQDDLMVVFSQDPHDVAKMSYERNWTSCMELGGGGHYESVLCEVSSGGFVAYLITSDDKEIENPLARIHIRRFINQNGISFAKPEENVYGNSVSGFEEFVEDWISKNNAKRYELSGQEEAGVYRLMGGDYSDTYSNVEIKLPKSLPEMIQWFQEPPEIESSQWLFTDNFYDELESIGYWDYEVKLDFVEENYDGYKYFETKEQAESFKTQMQYADYYDSWIESILGSEEIERLEEADEYDDKIDEMMQERYTIEEVKESYAEKIKKEVADRLVLTQIGSVGPELAKVLLEYHKDNFLRKILIWKRYPNLLTMEEFKELSIEHKSQIISAFDKIAPEQKARFYEVQKEELLNLLNPDSEEFEEHLKKKLSIAFGFKSDKTACAQSSVVRRVIIDTLNAVFKNEIDDEIYTALTKFLFEDLDKIEKLNCFDYRTQEHKSHRGNIYYNVLRLAKEKGLSSVNQIDFAKRMWNVVDVTIWDIDSKSEASVHEWLWFVKDMKSNGKPLIDIINSIIQNADKDTAENSGFERAVSDYKDFGSMDNIFEKIYEKARLDRIKEMKTRVRRSKYAIDCIENNQEFSSKYRWSE